MCVVNDVQVALQGNNHSHDSPHRFSPRGNQKPQFKRVAGSVHSPMELINFFLLGVQEVLLLMCETSSSAAVVAFCIDLISGKPENSAL